MLVLMRVLAGVIALTFVLLASFITLAVALASNKRAFCMRTYRNSLPVSRAAREQNTGTDNRDGSLANPLRG